jgi:hypothetical protein
MEDNWAERSVVVAVKVMVAAARLVAVAVGVIVE